MTIKMPCDIYIYEINIEQYEELKKIYDQDAYFHCKNIQESKQNNVYYLDEVKQEEDFLEEKKECSQKLVYDGKKKIRNPKKYFNHIKEL